MVTDVFFQKAAESMSTCLDARALSKLRWRCRRGLLENDLFIERFFARFETTLTHFQADGLALLMDLSDNDLLDLLLRRTEPSGELLRDDVAQALHLLRLPSEKTSISTLHS